MALIGPSLSEKREALVRQHMDLENRNDYEGTIETFDHPRYELIPTGDVYDGHDEVAAYFEETRSAFPDQRNELVSLRHSDDAVIVEGLLRGTHTGNYRGLPPTGRAFEMQFLALFMFEGERLMCERIYFDVGSVLQQLGIARDPLTLGGKLETLAAHPVTIGRAFARNLFRR